MRPIGTDQTAEHGPECGEKGAAGVRDGERGRLRGIQRAGECARDEAMVRGRGESGEFWNFKMKLDILRKHVQRQGRIQDFGLGVYPCSGCNQKVLRGIGGPDRACRVNFLLQI